MHSHPLGRLFVLSAPGTTIFDLLLLSSYPLDQAPTEPIQLARHELVPTVRNKVSPIY